MLKVVLLTLIILHVSGEILSELEPIPPEESCGVPEILTPKPQSRIVNGTEVVRGRWPWQAMILRRDTADHWFRHICGGTLIAKQWVLTAAHCHIRYLASDLHVSLGRIFLNEDRNESSKITLAVMSVHRHSAYHRWSNANDISLLKLPSEIIFNQYIKPACLPAPHTDVQIGQICTVTGWGETKGTGSREILREAHVSIIDRDSCASWYAEESISIPENHTCAGHKEGLIDSCQGDSGGPLVCIELLPDKGLAFVLRGVTSFGAGCARSKRPGVYTTVSKFEDWIAEVIAEKSTDCLTKNVSVASEGLITSNGTIIRSPTNLQTGFHLPNTSVSWSITAPADQHIHLHFICLFNLQGSMNGHGCNDYVKITSRSIGYEEIFCGVRLPLPVVLNSDEATVTFNSDSSLESIGFMLQVLFMKNVNISNTTESFTESVTERITLTTPSTMTTNSEPSIIMTESKNYTEYSNFFFTTRLSITNFSNSASDTISNTFQGTNIYISTSATNSVNGSLAVDFNTTTESTSRDNLSTDFNKITTPRDVEYQSNTNSHRSSMIITTTNSNVKVVFSKTTVLGVLLLYCLGIEKS